MVKSKQWNCRCHNDYVLAGSQKSSRSIHEGWIKTPFYNKILFYDFDTNKLNIFSKGHRNPGSIFVDQDVIISTEHGPRGGDEINNIKFNGNYGWPIVSYGEPYYFEEFYDKDISLKKSIRFSSGWQIRFFFSIFVICSRTVLRFPFVWSPEAKEIMKAVFFLCPWATQPF